MSRLDKIVRDSSKLKQALDSGIVLEARVETHQRPTYWLEDASKQVELPHGLPVQIVGYKTEGGQDWVRVDVIAQGCVLTLSIPMLRMSGVFGNDWVAGLETVDEHREAFERVMRGPDDVNWDEYEDAGQWQ